MCPFLMCIFCKILIKLFVSADAGGGESIVDQVSSRDMADSRNRDISGQKSVSGFFNFYRKGFSAESRILLLENKYPPPHLFLIFSCFCLI